MKKLMSMLIATLMVVSMGITGFAEESGIKVVLDGQKVVFNDAKPVEKEGRVMVPFATIFEAMGATVKYENSTIIANLGNKELKMKENSNTAELITDGKSEIIEMKVPAFVEKGRSYVPVSTISLGFGFDVYWDEKTQTVNVINAQKLINEVNSKYTIYNSMMKTENSLDMNKTYKTNMDGNLDLNIDKEMTGDTVDMVLAAKANIEALAKGMNLSAKGSVQVDTVKSNITDSLGEEEKYLQNVPFEVILNADAGKLYLNMPLAIEGDESLKNTWLEIAVDPMTAVALEQVKASMTGKTDLTIGNLAYTIAWGMKDSLSTLGMDVYSYVKQMDKIYEIVIADDLFTKTTEGATTVYTASMNKTQIIARAAKVMGISITDNEMKEIVNIIEKIDYKMVLKIKDGKLIDSTIDMNMSMIDGEEKIEMVMAVKGNEKDSDMKINITLGKTKFAFDFKAASTETKETVKTAPPADATIVDLTEAMNTAVESVSNIGIIGGEDGPTSIIAVPAEVKPAA